jgi:hypothetical protein
VGDVLISVKGAFIPDSLYKIIRFKTKKLLLHT